MSNMSMIDILESQPTKYTKILHMFFHKRDKICSTCYSIKNTKFQSLETVKERYCSKKIQATQIHT